MPAQKRGHFFMSFVQGEGRTQGTLFPVCLEGLIPGDHVCRVTDVFVDRVDMALWDLSGLRRPRPGGLAMIRAIC
jgi:hypothetical protein